MVERVRQIVKRGTWLYDGTVPCEVRVIKTNYFEHPGPDDEEKDESYPPRDADGNFYFVERICRLRFRLLRFLRRRGSGSD
jgi:hypothetical protein